MKRIILTLSLLLTIQTKAFQEIYSYSEIATDKISASTWVIFDIDNTILRSLGQIGSPQWSEHIKSEALEAGYSAEQAETLSHQLFAQAQAADGYQTEPVDIKIVDFLKALSKKSIQSFTLTARSKSSLQLVTYNQLASLTYRLNIGAYFHSHSPEWKSTPFIQQNEFRGIIFASGRDKGDILKQLIQSAKTRPSKIIFIDDKVHNVQAVEKVWLETGIPIEAYLLRAADDFVAKFRPPAADTHWLYIKYLASSARFAFTESPWTLDLFRNPILLAGHILRSLVDPSEVVVQVNCPATVSGHTYSHSCTYQICQEFREVDMGWGESQTECAVASPTIYHKTFEILYNFKYQYFYKSDWTLF